MPITYLDVPEGIRIDAQSDDGPDRGDVRQSPEAAKALKLLLQISVAAQATTISSRR